MTTYSTESRERRHASPLGLLDAGNEPSRCGDEPAQRRQEQPAGATQCCAAIIEGFDGFLG